MAPMIQRSKNEIFRAILSSRMLVIGLIGIVLTMLHIQIQLFSLAIIATNTEKHGNDESNRCAINLFGLPRAFDSLVLPSLQKHVIATNPKCDYFVHYYNLTFEEKGRSTMKGGSVHPEQVRLLAQAVHKYNPHAGVRFAVTSEDEFWSKYQYTVLDKIHNTKDAQGNYLYFPWKARTYEYPTTVDNIIKMWHSIEAAWNLMNEYAATRTIARQPQKRKYTRVAMLRLDVVYMTPIDIWKKENGQVDYENQVAVIPGFARFPVSDRIIYGPYDAVQVWATGRLERLDDHVQWILQNDYGFGLHSERFVNHSILPAIRQRGYRIWQHDTLCFFRARVDESLWVTDCWGRTPEEANPRIVAALFGPQVQDIYQVTAASRPLVEKVLGRSCVPGNLTRIRRMVTALNCGKG